MTLAQPATHLLPGLFAQGAAGVRDGVARRITWSRSIAISAGRTYNRLAGKAGKKGWGVESNDDQAGTTPLRSATATVMFLDVVQSVVIIERDGLDGIECIRSFLTACGTEHATRHGGTLLQRMGDGLLLQFASPRQAIAFADAAHALALAMSPAVQPLRLRIGIHHASMYTDDTAFYGLGVNVAARIASEALAGETVVSADLVDGLKPGLDVEIEDLGECQLKHLQSPIRLFRARAPDSAASALPPVHEDSSALPVVAVFPLIARQAGTAAPVVGELFADGLITELSRVRGFRVISRQSTGLLDGTDVQLRASQVLQPHYTVSGRFMAHGDGLQLWVELREGRSDVVLWAERLATHLDELLDPDARLLHGLSCDIALAIGEHALARAHFSPLRSLPSCELLFGAIAMTGRTSLAHFERPRELLEALIDRHRSSVLPRVWLAHWHVIRRVQGRTPAGQDDGRQALFMADRALDLDPRNAHAMATQGFAAMHCQHDLALARERLDAAIAEDRSCAWAWLYRGALHAFTSEGEQAERDCAEALACSPLDPMRHFFLSISATAAFTNRAYDKAVDLALASRRHDRYHASTVRVLAMSLALGGRLDEARDVGTELLRIEPGLTVDAYLRRTPSARFEVGERCAEGLRLAGVPGH